MRTVGYAYGRPEMPGRPCCARCKRCRVRIARCIFCGYPCVFVQRESTVAYVCPRQTGDSQWAVGIVNRCSCEYRIDRFNEHTLASCAQPRCNLVTGLTVSRTKLTRLICEVGPRV